MVPQAEVKDARVFSSLPAVLLLRVNNYVVTETLIGCQAAAGGEERRIVDHQGAALQVTGAKTRNHEMWRATYVLSNIINNEYFAGITLLLHYTRLWWETEQYLG